MIHTSHPVVRVCLEDAVTRLLAVVDGEVIQEVTHGLGLRGGAEYALHSGDIKSYPANHSIPEWLFKPSLIGLEQEGIHKVTYEFILKCDVHLHELWWNHVEVTGNHPDLAAIAARLRDELVALAPSGTDVQVRVGA